jgi:hypothetical protein
MASFMPVAVFAATATATSLAVGISLARLKGRFGSQDGETTGEGTGRILTMWIKWQLLVGMAGFVVFPQVLMSSLMLPGQGGAGLVTFLALSAYFLNKVCPTNSAGNLMLLVDGNCFILKLIWMKNNLSLCAHVLHVGRLKA